MIKNPHELKLGTDERSVFPKGLAIDEEVYLEATSFEVATCPTLKGWRREEICFNVPHSWHYVSLRSFLSQVTINQCLLMGLLKA